MTIRDWSATQRVVLTAIITSVLIFAVEVYLRRWMSDDGLIAVRTPQQFLAGHGLSFTPYDRDESNTSVLWTWLLTALAAVSPGDTADWAVGLGLVISVSAFAIGLDASRRFHRKRGTTGLLLPAGALVILALPPFWDFATSGLETSLSFLWLAGSWWLLVATGADTSPRRCRSAALVFGLGSLVRPEFAILSVLLLVGLILVRRSREREALSFVATAAALPLAYEVFRAGYYGVLVPGPAIAKEAAGSDWSRGLDYLLDFVQPYMLWVPALLLTAAAIGVFRGRPRSTSDLMVLGVPLIGGELLALYVMAVGGDYMHARMWLPPLFLVLLPLFLIPFSGRAVRVSVAALGVWALVVATTSKLSYHGTQYGPAPLFLADERSWEIAAYHNAHPVGSENHATTARITALVSDAVTSHKHVLIIGDDGLPTNAVPLAADRPEPLVIFAGNMGTGAVLLPANGGIDDVNGIVSSLSAHQMLGDRIRAGHEKHLPLAWALAEYADPVAVDGYDWGDKAPKAEIAAARHALTCGSLRELLDATEAPLTPARFWDNVVGAFHRTTFRFPPDPAAAEREYCR